MTSDKKRKQAVRARAEKTNMSYAATINAESPYRASNRLQSTPFSGYYVPPFSPGVLAGLFAEFEQRNQRVVHLRVNAQALGELRTFARDVIDFTNDFVPPGGDLGKVWGATIRMDNSLIGTEFIVDHEVQSSEEDKSEDLVIVIRAAKPIKGGVGEGHLQLQSPQIFMGSEQVGFIQRVTFQAVANALMSHLEFEFPADTVLSDTSRTTVEQTIAQLRQAFPWVTIGRLTTTPTEVVNPKRTVTKFEDIRELFTAIIQKRDSIKGSSLVLPCDDPKQLLIGWVVEDTAQRTFEFYIKMSNLLRTKQHVSSHVLAALPNVEGRLQIARALSQGATVDTLDDALEAFHITADLLRAAADPDYSIVSRLDWNAVNLKHLSAELQAYLKQQRDPKIWSDLQQVILGKTGLLTSLLHELRDLPPDERAKRGAALNQFKSELEALFNGSTNVQYSVTHNYR